MPRAEHRRFNVISRLIVCAAILFFSGFQQSQAVSTETPSRRPQTAADVMDIYGKDMRARLAPIFAMHNVAYPPKEMTWIGLKEEKVLLIFAKDMSGKMRLVLTYPVIGTSGLSGPKLREGDLQVPEGFYKLSRFRPVVMAHLGLEVDYPNAEDKRRGKKEGRSKLGGDIMIHGSFWSTGCLAMGNEAIEELFVLAHDAGLQNIQVIFAPCNLALRKPQVNVKNPPVWLPELYQRLRVALRSYPIPRLSSNLVGSAAPPFKDLQWLNSPPLQLDKLRGKVVLIRFWTADCGYCETTAEALNKLHADFSKRGLVVIGIHHPKSIASRSPDYVRDASTRMGFQFPIAQDLDWKTVNEYWLNGNDRQFTSASFLIDGQGRIVWVHPGGEYHESRDIAHKKCDTDLIELRQQIKWLLDRT